MTDPPHAPTRVTGTAHTKGGEVTYDYVGCTVCRLDHPIVGRTPMPFHKAHPPGGGLPSTATQDVPDGTQVRQ